MIGKSYLLLVIVYISFLICISLIVEVVAFTKVLVPSVYHEFAPPNYPPWVMDTDILAKYNYSVFLYQKRDPALPHYVRNHGTEGGVYLKYIIDHYDNFPDVAIFVHGEPKHHQAHWLQILGCISPNATYTNINFGMVERDSEYWYNGSSIYVEQCWKDMLKIAWNLEGKENQAKFDELVPVNKPVFVRFHCCQQFLMSRDMVRKRPLSVWKKLFRIVNEQDVCHQGELEYEHLYAFYKHNQTRVGPETPGLIQLGERPQDGIGRHTQGGGMEHLAHVIFGHLPLVMADPTMDDMCQNFLPDCPFSPCVREKKTV